MGPKLPSYRYRIGQMANFSTIPSDSKVVGDVRHKPKTVRSIWTHSPRSSYGSLVMSGFYCDPSSRDRSLRRRKRVRVSPKTGTVHTRTISSVGASGLDVSSRTGWSPKTRNFHIPLLNGAHWTADIGTACKTKKEHEF